MGNRCVLLHINRKVKKIFIFAANLKQKKEKVIRYKIDNRQAGITLNTYREPKPVTAVKGRCDFVYSLATG